MSMNRTRFWPETEQSAITRAIRKVGCPEADVDVYSVEEYPDEFWVEFENERTRRVCVVIVDRASGAARLSSVNGVEVEDE